MFVLAFLHHLPIVQDAALQPASEKRQCEFDIFPFARALPMVRSGACPTTELSTAPD